MSTKYVGSELDLFSGALNWKAYWSDLIKPSIGRRILDVGAGLGATARLFAKLDCDCYLALEPDDSLLDRMKRDAEKGLFHEKFEMLSGTTEILSPDQRFDTILYIDVLEHIVDDKQELTRAASHLMPGGRIIVLSPAHQWLFTPFDEAIGHVQRYNKRALLAAKPAGLATERLFYLDCVGMIASLGNRFLLRSSSPSVAQIQLWDRWMVPASKVVDRITGFGLGKSIVAVFKETS